MKIYSTAPTNWINLQKKVAQLLSELGYITEIEKNIQTAREIINVDVYAVSTTDIPQTKIICECKYWDKPVPKTIIHAFRTTVGDFGANFGIIISKAGFQSGSYKAVENTNILLLDWNEFEDYFKIRWIKNKQLSISKETKPLFDYVSVGFRVFFKERYSALSDIDLKKFEDLTEKHFHVAFHSSNLDYRDESTGEFNIGLFERSYKQAEKEFNSTFTSYEDYFSFLAENAKNGVREFDELLGEPMRRNSD